MSDAALYVMENDQDQKVFIGSVHKNDDNEYVAMVTTISGRRNKVVEKSKPQTYMEAAIFWLQSHETMQGGVVCM